MVFLVYPQYPDRAYNQRSLQVTTKIAKSSVKRNMIKRLFYQQLEKDLPVEKTLNENFYKIFVYFHKAMPEELAKLLANTDKNTIKNQIIAQFHEHFISFPDLVCRFSDFSKTSVQPSRRKPIA
ncbi:hypothetical protein KBC03_02330 [Patescibacteria group bacterium]|nr:hypothetical protein [Patescibacteria group bacterium]